MGVTQKQKSIKEQKESLILRYHEVPLLSINALGYLEVHHGPDQTPFTQFISRHQIREENRDRDSYYRKEMICSPEPVSPIANLPKTKGLSIHI